MCLLDRLNEVGRENKTEHKQTNENPSQRAGGWSSCVYDKFYKLAGCDSLSVKHVTSSGLHSLLLFSLSYVQ